MNPKSAGLRAPTTPRRGILKVIEPLFLDDLRDEFKRLTGAAIAAAKGDRSVS